MKAKRVFGTWRRSGYGKGLIESRELESEEVAS